MVSQSQTTNVTIIMQTLSFTADNAGDQAVL